MTKRTVDSPRIKRLVEHYPCIHLFGNVWLIRRYTRAAKRFSLWTIRWFR